MILRSQFHIRHLCSACAVDGDDVLIPVRVPAGSDRYIRVPSERIHVNYPEDPIAMLEGLTPPATSYRLPFHCHVRHLYGVRAVDLCCILPFSVPAGGNRYAWVPGEPIRADN